MAPDLWPVGDHPVGRRRRRHFRRLVWGALSDLWGRKALIVSGSFICAFGAAAIAVIPDGAWVLLRSVAFSGRLWSRRLVRAGHDHGRRDHADPPSHRRRQPLCYLRHARRIPRLVSTVAALFDLIGWRGIAALGVAPAVIGVGVLLFVPESVRWLTAKGRFREAQATVASLLHLPLSEVPLPSVTPSAPPRASLEELYARPPLFWLTLLTWQAADQGRLWHAAVGADDRRAADDHIGAGSGALLCLCHRRRDRRQIPLRSSRRCWDGAAWVRCTGPASSSAWPPRRIFIRRSSAAVRLLCRRPRTDRFLQFGRLFEPRAVHSGGLWRADGGARLGPRPSSKRRRQDPRAVGLAVIAGTSNVLKPAATEAAVFPAFIFLACCGLAVGLAFTFLAHETHGKAVPAGSPSAGVGWLPGSRRPAPAHIHRGVVWREGVTSRALTKPWPGDSCGGLMRPNASKT